VPAALTVKVILAALLLAGGGWALASGVAPNPLDPGHAPSNRPPSGGVPPSTPRPHPAASTASTASFVGKCQAVRQQPSSQQATLLATPAMADLVAAAGGQDEVEAFCAGLLGAATPSAHPSPHASGSHDPAGGGAATPPTSHAPLTATPSHPSR
jgi:hypothetical protein